MDITTYAILKAQLESAVANIDSGKMDKFGAVHSDTEEITVMTEGKSLEFVTHGPRGTAAMGISPDGAYIYNGVLGRAGFACVDILGGQIILRGGEVDEESPITLTGVAAPVGNNDAVNKIYVDEALLNIELQPGPQGDPGADGQTPEKGTDYWTETDKAEIVADVLEALPTADSEGY